MVKVKFKLMEIGKISWEYFGKENREYKRDIKDKEYVKISTQCVFLYSSKI